MPVDIPSMPAADPANALLYPDGRIQHSHVLRVDEIFAGTSGVGFQASSMHRNYVRKFRVLLAPGLDGSAPPTTDQVDVTDIFKDRRIPRPYASFFSNWSNPNPVEGPLGGVNRLADLNALAVEHSLDRENTDDTQTWILTVRYSTDIGKSGPDYRIMWGGVQLFEQMTNPNAPQFKPWYARPEFTWSSVDATVARQFDINGKPFLNSAGDPFAPAPTVEVSYPLLTIVRNEETFTPTKFGYWAHAVNNATFMDHAEDCVQVMPPSASVEWHGAQKYYRATWRLRFKPPGISLNVWDVTATPPALVVKPESWQTQLLDAGFYQRVTPPVGPAVRAPIYRGGHRVSNSPALLNGQGVKLADGGNPVYLEFVTRQRRDLSTLFNNDMVP